jgi:hypothetical protein
MVRPSFLPDRCPIPLQKRHPLSLLSSFIHDSAFYLDPETFFCSPDPVPTLRNFYVTLFFSASSCSIGNSLELNGPNLYCFLSSLPLLSPLATVAVFGSCLPSLLFTHNKHCIAGAGLPTHMIGEVLCEPKRKDERWPLSI